MYTMTYKKMLTYAQEYCKQKVEHFKEKKDSATDARFYLAWEENENKYRNEYKELALIESAIDSIINDKVSEHVKYKRQHLF